jgi:hypothetical protein
LAGTLASRPRLALKIDERFGLAGIDYGRTHEVVVTLG